MYVSALQLTGDRVGMWLRAENWRGAQQAGRWPPRVAGLQLGGIWGCLVRQFQRHTLCRWRALALSSLINPRRIRTREEEAGLGGGGCEVVRTGTSPGVGIWGLASSWEEWRR